ncbi:MAG: TerC family protein [Hyphomicrobiales bacterium]
MELASFQFLPVLQILWIDLLLSGDNAIIIALACRALPPRQKRIGMVLGASVAIGLRLAFTFIVVQLLEISFIKLVGGALLIWIAVRLILDESSSDHDTIPAPEKLWHAVRTIAIADLVMSLDNVVAIAAVADGDFSLIVFGVLLSIPLIIGGSTLLLALISRYPLLVWLGAGLLGWVAGKMAVSDPWLRTITAQETIKAVELPVSIAGVVVVLVLTWIIRGSTLRKQGQSID